MSCNDPLEYLANELNIMQKPQLWEVNDTKWKFYLSTLAVIGRNAANVLQCFTNTHNCQMFCVNWKRKEKFSNRWISWNWFWIILCQNHHMIYCNQFYNIDFLFRKHKIEMLRFTTQAKYYSESDFLALPWWRTKLVFDNKTSSS